MREIVLDTETTGFDPFDGDRIIEIGCIELVNQVPSGRTYHQYINPERDVPEEAQAVHGITDDFLKDKPVFGEIAGAFMDFIEGGKLVIHNAAFDIKFINFEIELFGYKPIAMNTVEDTLLRARRMFPGSPANLDSLCRRFQIDNTSRTLHGALLDAELLAEVYLELLGGRQHGLFIAPKSDGDDKDTDTGNDDVELIKKRPYHPPRQFDLSAAESSAHEAFCAELKEPLWTTIKKA
jgi:DNA polymerase-3 subunit epsilon